MTKYHIAANGEPAVCKAQTEASCPRGGKHFPTKDQADFYVSIHSMSADTNPAAPVRSKDWSSDSIYSNLRLMDDEMLVEHLAVMTQYINAVRFGNIAAREAADKAVDGLGEGGAVYRWAPSTAQARLATEDYRRHGALHEMQDELGDRLYNAENNLGDLYENDSENVQLANKIAAVHHFRESWVNRFASVKTNSQARALLAEFDQARQRAGSPEARETEQPGWDQGMDLARGFVRRYIRSA